MIPTPSETLKAVKLIDVRVVENGFIVADSSSNVCGEKCLWVFPDPFHLRQWMMEWGDAHHPLEVEDADEPLAENADGCAKDSDAPMPTQAPGSPSGTILVTARASSVPSFFDYRTSSHVAFGLLTELKHQEPSFGFTAQYYRDGRLDGVPEHWCLVSFRDLVSFVVEAFPNALTARQILSLI